MTSALCHILDHLMRIKKEGDVLIVKTFSLSLLTPPSCRDFSFFGTLLYSWFFF